MADAGGRNGVFSNGTANGRREADAPVYGRGAATTGVDQLRELAGLLWRHRWMFLAVALLVAVAAAAYTFSLPKVYQTSSLLLVDPDRGGAGGRISLQMSGFGRGQGTALSNELLVINQSNELAQRVARRLLENPPRAGQPRAGQGGGPLPVTRTQGGRTLAPEALAGRLRGRVSAQRAGEGVDAILIRATGTAPRETAAIANAYAEEYIRRAREQSRADIRGSRSFLEEQATRMSGRLDSLENQLSEYMRRNEAAALDQEASRTVGRIATLEAQRDEARIELEMKKAALEKKEEELARIEPQLAERAASSVEAQLRQVQEQLAREQGRLREIYEQNPSMRDNPDAGTRNVKQKIERLRERSKALSEQYVNETLEAGGIDPTAGGGGSGGGSGGGGQGLAYVAQQRREIAQSRIAIGGLEAKIETLGERLAEYRAKLEDIPQQSMELAQMQRARQSAEKLYTFVIEKLQEARIREQSKIGYAEVVNPAGVPGVPFKPNTRRNLILGVLLGLMLGAGLVLLRDRLDTTLRRPEDLREQGYDVAGVVPDLAPLREEDFGGSPTVTANGREVSTDLPMLLSPMSGAAEAYRRLRNTVQFSRPDTVVQALMVTSAGQGEGKTTTALNAAIAMAQAGRRTLVVDADLHRPRAHRTLGHAGEPGLTDVLFERRPFETTRIDTGIDHLHLLPAGSEVPKPAELLGSGKMRAFVEQVREAYDVIVFDTPPVGALSDAMLLATQCEGTLMVARAGETDQRAFNAAFEALSNVGATFLGVVLNGFDAEDDGYYYGYYYGYGDRYGGGRAGYGPPREERSAITSA